MFTVHEARVRCGSAVSAQGQAGQERQRESAAGWFRAGTRGGACRITTLAFATSGAFLSLACGSDPTVFMLSRPLEGQSPTVEPCLTSPLGCQGAPAATDGDSVTPEAPATADPTLDTGEASPPVSGLETGVAGSPAPAVQPQAPMGAAPEASVGGPDAADACWQMPVVSRARLFPAAGQPGALAGAKIAGSNTSAMNGFVDLAVVADTGSEGTWLDVPLANATPYRYVKYYGPAGSYGALAEVEFYAGETRLTGGAFGTAGSRDALGNTFDRALDGDTSSVFEGPLPNDNYVGLDLAAEHVPATPTLSPTAGTYAVPPVVTLSGEPGAQLFYTTDGTDPRLQGIPYTAAFSMTATGIVRVAATRECAAWSEPTQALYRVGAAASSSSATVQSSIHIGNSLTDTIVNLFEGVAASGGITVDFNRYTIPGAGTWLYADNPTGGFGVANVQESLRTRPFDHVSMQPFPNMPCQVTASADGDDSDSGYLNMAWTDARTQNPNVQFWVYQQWPAPLDYTDCITGGSWSRSDWVPPAPQSWEDAVANELAYQEAVRAELVRLNPTAPPPYIVPAGTALVALKHAVEAGAVPGISDFFGQLFNAAGTDIHLNPAGAYYVTLVFYACMFQDDPEGQVPDPVTGVTAEQAAILQRLAWQTVSGYALSGVPR